MKKIKYVIVLFILLVVPIISVHANKCSDYTVDNCPKSTAEGTCECDSSGECFLSTYGGQTCFAKKTEEACESNILCGWNDGVCTRGVKRKVGPVPDDDYSCEGTKWFPLFQLAKFIIRIIQIGVPFALIIWGSLDWFKALIAHDEKEMRIKRKPFVSRVIAALLIFFLPWILQYVSEKLAGKKNSVNFWLCYSEAQPKIDFKEWELDPLEEDDPEPITGISLGGELAQEVIECVRNSSSSTTDPSVSQEIHDMIDGSTNQDSKTEENDDSGNNPNSQVKGESKHCQDYDMTKGEECPPHDDYNVQCGELKSKGVKHCVPIQGMGGDDPTLPSQDMR